VRLLSFERGGAVRIGTRLDEKIVDLYMASVSYFADLGEVNPDAKACEHLPPCMKEFLQRGDQGLQLARTVLDFLKGQLKTSGTVIGPSGERIIYHESEVKLKPPVPDPNKIICLGLNYRDHAREAGAELPANPIIFSKFATALIGPGDPIVYPKAVRQLDYEIELAFIIGRRGRHIPEEKAYGYIAGYTIFNDVSARDIQFADGQWTRAKSFDTFAPMGPYLVTRDEVPDPHDLAMQLRVNGKVMQDSNTSNMAFKIPYILSFLSQAFTLEPGDVVATGTPAGVGIFRDPPALLRAGDVVELEIEGLGRLRNPVLAGQ